MPAIEKVDKIWVDGELVDWDEAKEHMLAHTLHYGLGAFEGIRAYERADGRTAIFRLNAHIDRLFDSCKIASIEVPFAQSVLRDACCSVIRDNKLKSAYIRPLVFLGSGALGLGTLDAPVRCVVAAFQWGAYLGDGGLQKGIRCTVSGFRRGNTDSFMSKGKLCGQYVTSILAKRAALRSGFDEALMLDSNGLVTEGSGENLFVVRDHTVMTPPTSASILAGITRASIMQIARDLGYHVQEGQVTRDELWTADEVFLTGTAAEVTPVREIDFRKIGSGEPGPITRRLQDHYFGIVKGDNNNYNDWLTYV